MDVSWPQLGRGWDLGKNEMLMLRLLGLDQDLVHVSFCSLSLVRSWFCLTQRVLWEPCFPSMNVNKGIHQDWKSRRGVGWALLTFTAQSIWLSGLRLMLFNEGFYWTIHLYVIYAISDITDQILPGPGEMKHLDSWFHCFHNKCQAQKVSLHIF